LFLANAGIAKQTVEYIVDANVYGQYVDTYLQGKTNPHMIDFTTDGRSVGHEASVRKPNPVTFNLDFSRPGAYLDFNNVSAIHNIAHCNTGKSTKSIPDPESRQGGDTQKKSQQQK